MKFLSLFSGIGGFDIGFERAGMQCVGQVEIDPHCQKLLKAKWPNIPKWTDVTEFKGSYLDERPDVICFGSPCQDLSIAGRRAGLSGERSGLFFEAIRIVRELEPAFAVWENVPGAFSSNDGRDFALALNAFLECGARDVAWGVLDAQYFGVAQRRRRVFVVADFRGERAGEILFESESLSWNPETRRKERQKTSSRIRDGVAGTLGSKSSGGHDPTDFERNGAFIPETAHTLADATKGGANDLNRLGALIAVGVDGSDTGFTLRSNPSHSGDKGDGGINTTMVVQSFGWNKSPSQTMRVNEDITEALQASPTSNPAVVSSVTSKWARGSGEPAGDECQNLVTTPVRGVRRLTPLECERLQGFPDGHTEGFSDSIRYRMLGNAVCVNVGEYIGKRIMASAILEEYA